MRGMWGGSSASIKGCTTRPTMCWRTCGSSRGRPGRTTHSTRGSSSSRAHLFISRRIGWARRLPCSDWRRRISERTRRCTKGLTCVTCWSWRRPGASWRPIRLRKTLSELLLSRVSHCRVDWGLKRIWRPAEGVDLQAGQGEGLESAALSRATSALSRSISGGRTRSRAAWSWRSRKGRDSR